MLRFLSRQLNHYKTAMADGLTGKFEVEDIKITTPENMHYVISYEWE